MPHGAIKDMVVVFNMLFIPLLNGVPGSPASPGRFSGRGAVQPAGYTLTA
jgi:hypothetical protein